MQRESWIEFVRWPHEDDTWHVTIAAADAAYCVNQEFYSHPSGLIELASALQSFPRHGGDEVRFNAGSKDPGWAHWVFLRAFIVDTSGHAALTVDVGSRGNDVRTRSARFTIGCDVASLNRLGASLRQWIDEPRTPLREPLYSS